MANYSDIAHRFANKLEGRNGRISAGNVRYEGRNYFSYSTVFGQWLDISKNVVAIFDGSTSTSSSKHKLHKGLFPDDVHVFPLDFSGGYYGWRNCNLVSEYWHGGDECFKEYHRMQMIDHYIGRIYTQLLQIDGGKSKGLENVDFSAWGYIEELCSLYKDTSVSKWIKWSCKDKHDENGKLKRKLARMLKDGERNVEVLTDALFGEGTYKTYWDYCARFRKAEMKKTQLEMLCARIGIASPYHASYWQSKVLHTDMTADQIRKLTAKERLELHFKALAFAEDVSKNDEREAKYWRNFRNAYKWIVGFNPKANQWGNRYSRDVHNNCVDKNTGVVYECCGGHIYDFYWCETSIEFDYNGFRSAEDKEQWIADFYAKCKDVALNRKAIGILKRIGAHTKEKARSWEDDVYINDDYLRENTTEGDYEICVEFIRKQDKHYADEEAQRRAAEIARLKREEEERKEREYREQVKQSMITAYIEEGTSGCRKLWREHFTSVYEAEQRFDEVAFKDEGEFYMGGNVLLRLSLDKKRVETSKDIRMPIEVAKKMFAIVKKWHDNPKCFKPMEIDTKGSGKYEIVSYENDILTAGCHKIAYAEMERCYNEIINVNVA